MTSPDPTKGSSASAFRIDGQTLLRQTFKPTGSDSPRSPRTTSQLKLLELSAQEAKTGEEIPENFGMHEVRDGFFDPVYRNHTNGGQVTTEQVAMPHKGINIKDELIEAKRHWRIITKFTLAYLIAITLCLTDTPGHWFGSHREWLPIATLINHPVHSVGAQVELTLQSIVGLALGLGWSSLALYISTATQPTRNHPGGILACSLFLGLFFMGWFKAYYIRFYYLLLSSGFVLIFLSTNVADEPVIVWRNCWDIAIPYLFGLLISLFVSVVYVPYLGHEKMTLELLKSTSSIRNLIQVLSSSDKSLDSETVVKAQRQMIQASLQLSEEFREFLSGTKLSLFNDEDLKSIRNHINFIVAPLRVIPTPTYLYKSTVEASSATLAATPIESGFVTPRPKPGGKLGFGNELIYLSIMDDAFNEPLFKLIDQMAAQMDQIETTIRTLNENTKNELITQLHDHKSLLKKRVHQIDVTYRRFAKSDYFSRDLLSEEAVINVFLFLRYSRQAAVMILDLTDTLAIAAQKVQRRKLYFPKYPLRRALRRLPEQCLRDQGADSVYHYFEAKIDVDDAFERIYNLNTSRTRQTEERNASTVRAIDHHDFTFHATKNSIRFKLWEITSSLTDSETKYAFKVSFAVIFLSLPAWLEESWDWYHTYRCYWCPVLVYFLLSPRNLSTWSNFSTRLMCWLLGCFWGWAANQAHHYKQSIVIGAFAVIWCIVFSYGFLVREHPRSSLIGLLSFTLVALDVKILAMESTASIWKHTWPLSLAILAGILSTAINWIVWRFSPKHELYQACHSLLQHIGQSYQSVSERYLYRDKDDDPTDLTLELANIREVRMSQSLQAVRRLLERARTEYDISGTFKPDVFELLLDSCDRVLEKTIEARMSGIYVKVWEGDEDEATTQVLKSFRRDSVTTVIYLLYMLSNAFLSKTMVPMYLPSSISVRKELYEMIAELESKRQTNIADQLMQRLTEVNTSDREDPSYIKSHWTEVHMMAFARAFTLITEELENIVQLAKEILGEEDMFS